VQVLSFDILTKNVGVVLVSLAKNLGKFFPLLHSRFGNPKTFNHFLPLSTKPRGRGLALTSRKALNLTADDVIDFYRSAEALGIEMWINGGVGCGCAAWQTNPAAQGPGHRDRAEAASIRQVASLMKGDLTMTSNGLRRTSAIVVVILVSLSVSQTRPAQSRSANTAEEPAKPLLLEKNEGERRIWREPPPGDFILKVSTKNNGSRHLVMGTEDMAPGDEFPTHKHLGQDEILYIEKGTVHVHLGNQERDLHAGGTVFIPAYTWVDVKNAGTEVVSVVFVFSAPGFENYMRCDSVLPNEKVVPLSVEGQKACGHEGHVIYKDLESPKQ
jgi:quercetin dioxygenase-like cupin family protein